MIEPAEQKLRRYLTGDLPEPEQLKIESDYLSNDEAFEQLREIENDLVDEYVCGELTVEERSLFEKNYLTTPLHRQRVLLSQSLIRAAEAERISDKNIVGVPSASWLSALFSGLKLHQLAWALAAVFIALMGGWFLMRPQPVNVTNPEIAKAEPPPIIIPSIPNLETQNPKPETISSPKPETRNLKPVPTFVLTGAFNIAETRGIKSSKRPADSAKTLALEKGIEKINLRMALEGEKYTKYQAEIRAVDSNKIFTVTTTSPPPSAKNISLTIPAMRLATADYILTLSGITPTGEREEINQYPFRVTRK